MNKYKRWSEWRKWDLHFHTPSSYDYWDKSVTNGNIIDKLEENNISVVAITDHHIIDTGRIKELQKLWSKKNITILPWIELRCELWWSTSVHFIGIFPEDCNISDIWIKLSGKHWLTLSDINKQWDNHVYVDLKETAKTIKELGWIITIHWGTKTNTVESLKNKDAIKTDIVEVVDIYELWKVEDKDKIYEQIVFPALKKKFPLIICSDNHDINNYEIKENLWIKADPTFEWLKQIIYEPEERVKIQELKPEEKEWYRVIDKVIFENDNFTTEEILFNQNLNVIIWSRSSGKTTLLSHIANVIDPLQVKNERKYTPIKDWCKFKVYWKDWEGWYSGDQPENRWIIYIPQNHINKLAEVQDENSEILKFIEKVLIYGDNWKGLSEKKEKLEKDLNILNGDVKLKITDLFSTLDLIDNQRIKIKSFWDKKWIDQELNKITEEIKKLNSWISENSVIEFNKIMDKWLENKKKIEVLSLDINILKEYIENNVEIIDKSIFKSIDLILNDKDNNDELLKLINELKLWFISKLKSELKIKIEILEKEIKRINEKNEKIKLDNKDLLEKWLKNKSARIKDKDRGKLKEKLIEIEKEEKILNSYITKKDKIINDLIISAEKRWNLRKWFTDSINKNIWWIEYSASVKIDVNKFNNFFDNNISYYYSSWAKTYFSWKVDKDNFFDKDGNIIKISLLLDYKWILDLLLNGNLKIKTNIKLRQVVENYFDDYEFINYTVRYEGDDYIEMTPWKKALVVLKLLIDSSSDQSPILIDQPEDDLDSRSIYKDISKFLIEKKKERQIIIVSHNANIVLWADAEEIIIANRHWVDNPNFEDIQFDYITWSIESVYLDKTKTWILHSKIIQEHSCDILEWWKEAFKLRWNKYNT